MIDINKITLSNGLCVIANHDPISPIVAVNLLYKTGSCDDPPDKTGLAHLFEHLMFGGTEIIPSYDKYVQLAGGENNAFTATDITDYYLTLPVTNIETALWLESDRMNKIPFSDENLAIQKNVVIEEFKQTTLNQPYGDAMHLLRSLVYTVHPYRWPVIGIEPSHIENVNLGDVKNHFFSHYAPNNAILAIAGNIQSNQVFKLAEKWFGGIEMRNIAQRNFPIEPEQTTPRLLDVVRNVPYHAIYKAYRTCTRGDSEYYIVDLITDLLSNGNSSRLYQSLVKEKQLFSDIYAYLSGDFYDGVLVISGNIFDGVNIEDADSAIEQEIAKLYLIPVSNYELDKVKNKIEAALVFSEVNNLAIAINLSMHEIIGDAARINSEIEKYRAVSALQIKQVSERILNPNRCCTVYYRSNNNKNDAS